MPGSHATDESVVCQFESLCRVPAALPSLSVNVDTRENTFAPSG